MTEFQIHQKLLRDYPELVHDKFPFPKPYVGGDEIKAIVLGADPTRILKDKTPQPFNVVFELDNPKSPYWRGIGKNIRLIDGLTEDNLYVQNLCRNYFTQETSKNKKWEAIARDYWVPFLRKELDELFPQSIPILITTQFILRACLTSGRPMKARTIYEECKAITPQENLLGRKVLALYRHHSYSLERRKDYAGFLGGEINSKSQTGKR